jgi:hypothetical protein
MVVRAPRWMMILLASALLGSVGGCGSGAGVASGGLPSGQTASLPCGSPKVGRHGQPAAAVILLDGVGSQEDGGTYYPFPVTNPRPGIPVVGNYCPLNGAYQERAFPDLASGLDSSLRRWSEFSVPGGSSGGSSSVPEASQACDRTAKRTILAPEPGPDPSPGSGQASPTPTIVVGTVPGGFGHGNCLTEALADAGAVLLPYSYTGATLSSGGTFMQNSYTADDSKQALCNSVSTLAREISSVHSAWPSTMIFLIGHSYGGLVAETWWYDEHEQGGGPCGIPPGSDGVAHVFSLDSPINGVQKCTLAVITAGTASQTWCSLWGNDFLHGVPNGLRIAAIDDHELSFTAVGTPNDPTYGLLAGGGGLEPQLVYDCLGNADENDPAARCIDKTGGTLPVSYPSASPVCDGNSGNIDGTTGHDIVKTCPAVIQLIVSALQLATNTTPRPSGAKDTVVKTFEPWVAVGQNGASAPAPGLVVTNGGTATCDSGSADDPGSALAVRCSPPGNGTPCFINDTGGGDPGSPLLCSSDPTSKQVIEVTPAGAGGIPIGLLNHGDVSQPPWFLILADGRKCSLLGYGTNTNVLSYDCGGNIGATIPDRSQPTWTVREGVYELNPTPSSATVAVVTAYH